MTQDPDGRVPGPVLRRASAGTGEYLVCSHFLSFVAA